MNEKFKCDLYRWYGSEGESIRNRIFRAPEIKWLSCFRKTGECKLPILKILYELKLRYLTKKTLIQIPSNTVIGKGFYIGHTGRIIINSNAVIGDNVNISTGVTIGQENRGIRKGSPIIKDNCWIGTNSVIVGNITVGSDVLIAPLTYVNFDVPDHSIVIGNPGRIIERENATKDYINRTV